MNEMGKANSCEEIYLMRFSLVLPVFIKAKTKPKWKERERTERGGRERGRERE